MKGRTVLQTSTSMLVSQALQPKTLLLASQVLLLLLFSSSVGPFLCTDSSTVTHTLISLPCNTPIFRCFDIYILPSMPDTNSQLLKPPSQYLLLPLTHLWQSTDFNSKCSSLSSLPEWFLRFMAPSIALSLRSANLKCSFINIIRLLSLIQLSTTPFPVSFSIC